VAGEAQPGLLQLRALAEESQPVAARVPVPGREPVQMKPRSSKQLLVDRPERVPEPEQVPPAAVRPLCHCSLVLQVSNSCIRLQPAQSAA